MSVMTVNPGDQITLDPSAKKVIMFDFDALNLATSVLLTNSGPTYGLTITAIRQASLAASLTYDNPSLVVGSRKVQARFLATTASRGDEYEVECVGTTDESPSQVKPYSIRILIQDQ